MRRLLRGASGHSAEFAPYPTGYAGYAGGLVAGHTTSGTRAMRRGVFLEHVPRTRSPGWADVLLELDFAASAQARPAAYTYVYGFARELPWYPAASRYAGMRHYACNMTMSTHRDSWLIFPDDANINPAASRVRLTCWH